MGDQEFDAGNAAKGVGGGSQDFSSTDRPSFAAYSSVYSSVYSSFFSSVYSSVYSFLYSFVYSFTSASAG